MRFHLNQKIDSLFKIIFLILLCLEIIACYYYYYTLGEVKQMLFVFIFLLNIIPVLCYFFRLKIIAYIIALIIGGIVIPYKVVLFIKWSELKKEALEIRKFVYNYKELNKIFPENILEYEFKKQKLAKHFSYRTANQQNFVLQYYIGTQGTTHYYNHKFGKWSYYPD